MIDMIYDIMTQKVRWTKQLTSKFDNCSKCQYIFRVKGISYLHISIHVLTRS